MTIGMSKKRVAPRPHAFTLVEVMMVVSIISVVFAIAAPNICRTRETAQARSCVRNLRQIDSAKEQYAMDNRLAQGADAPVPTERDVHCQ